MRLDDILLDFLEEDEVTRPGMQAYVPCGCYPLQRYCPVCKGQGFKETMLPKLSGDARVKK